MIQALLYGMKAGVSAVIVSVTWDMGTGIIKERDLILVIVMIVSFVANYFLNVGVVWIILATAVFGMIRTILHDHRRRQQNDIFKFIFAFLQINWSIQFWRRICRHATDTGTGHR